jgi:Fe-S-cluster containining protein
MRQDRRWDLFTCQRCGKCCVELPYDPDSIFEIAKFLGINVEQAIAKYYGRIVEDGKAWESEDYKRTPCPFLTAIGDMKSCAIYSVRPLGCRLYPFDTDFGRAGIDCDAAEKVYATLRKEDA